MTSVFKSSSAVKNIARHKEENRQTKASPERKRSVARHKVLSSEEIAKRGRDIYPKLGGGYVVCHKGQ